MPKVLISDKMSPRAAEVFKDRGIDVDVKPGMNPDELKKCIGDYEGLAIRSATKVTKDILEAAEKLRVVGRAGIGVDNVDIDTATARGVLVMNTPFGNSITTAEHAIALMFALARQIPQADASTQAGKWEKSKFMGVELTGKTLGIIGCGNIGTIVANRAKGLHMTVVAYDPYLAPERAAEIGVEKVDFEELLTRADFVSLHTPLTDGTRNILNKDTMGRMKAGVRIVNCARGGLINEGDLKDMLDSGHVAGAALDVFEEEPAKKNVLFGHERLVATPHLGASTEEAQENVAFQVAEQIADYLLTGTITNPINMAAVSSEEAPKLKPYIALARQLGGLAGQITESSIRSVQIEYQGDAANLNHKPLTAALLVGLLAPQLEGVNMVNAPVVAEERGIKVSEEAVEKRVDYQTRIRLTVVTERRTRTVCGTLVGGDKPRIIEVEGVQMEAELAPNMLFIRSQDEPGMIGRFGQTLSDGKINIGTFHLGRTKAGGEAISLISVDDPISDPVLMALCAIPHVQQVKALRF